MKANGHHFLSYPYRTWITLSILVGLLVTGCGVHRRSITPEEVAKVAAARDSLPAREETTEVATDSIPSDSLETVTELRDSLDRTTEPADSILREKQSEEIGDTIPTDSLQRDSVVPDSLLSELKAPMDFTSNDSIAIYPKRNIVRMYGEGTINYGDNKITGDFMEMKTDSGTIFSTYIDYPDSLQKERHYAKITIGQDEYEAKSMRYNVKTQRGYITDVITKQGEGYVVAQKTKRMENSDLYMKDGKYSTCENHEHPHYYIAMTEAKVRPAKDLVSGPVYLVVADVPLPIGLPFAFFPFTTKRSSGLLMPTYGEEGDRGFYLRNGGYYLALNDHVDLELTGDLYTKGSWGLTGRSTYRRRYRHSGSVNASYLKTKRGDRIAGDYSESTDFRIAWSHQQDPKADPYRTFSANVNFSTSSYNHNDLNALYNQAMMGQNTKSSSISFSRRFPNSPWSITGSVDITQRSQDSTVAVTLPNLSWSASRIFPFKRKKAVGKERWYEKISLSYSGQLRNSITTKENELFKKNIIKDWRNGVNHSIPVSASFDLFNYFKVTPSVSYNERWYSSRVTQAYDPEKDNIVPVDTTYGFNRVYDFRASLALSTTVYGFFKPMSWVPWAGKNVEMIRHRMEPSISLNYQPDFADPKFGYWEHLQYISRDGRPLDRWYSPYDGQLFGVPGRGKSGSVSLSVSNNVEAKLAAKSDSVQARKISLIDNLSFSTSYNLAADSFRWSDFQANIALRFTKDFTLRLGGSFDPYIWDYYEYDGKVVPYRVDKLRIAEGKGIGWFRGTSTSFSYNLNPTTLRELLGKVGLRRKDEKEGDDDSDNSTGTEQRPRGGSGNSPDGGGGGSLFSSGQSDLEYDAYGYSKNVIDWNLGFNYSLTMGQGPFDPKIREFTYKFSQDLSFNGNLSVTKNWHFNFSANYNFQLNKITNMSCNLQRDLHCWSMRASFIPVGPYKSYNFSIAVDASLLQDLKYQESSHPQRTNPWYY